MKMDDLRAELTKRRAHNAGSLWGPDRCRRAADSASVTCGKGPSARLPHRQACEVHDGRDLRRSHADDAHLMSVIMQGTRKPLQIRLHTADVVKELTNQKNPHRDSPAVSAAPRAPNRVPPRTDRATKVPKYRGWRHTSSHGDTTHRPAEDEAHDEGDPVGNAGCCSSPVDAESRYGPPQASHGHSRRDELHNARQSRRGWPPAAHSQGSWLPTTGPGREGAAKAGEQRPRSTAIDPRHEDWSRDPESHDGGQSPVDGQPNAALHHLSRLCGGAARSDGKITMQRLPKTTATMDATLTATE